MYHQFDRSMHPRQSVLNLIMNTSEQNKQLEEDIKELEAVSITKYVCALVTCSSDYSCYSAANFHLNVTAVWPSTYSVSGDLNFHCLFL